MSTQRERLEATYRHITTAGPERFNQSDWATQRTEEGSQNFDLDRIADGTVQVGKCGTAGCLAGHAVMAAIELGEIDDLWSEEELRGLDGKSTTYASIDPNDVAMWLGVDVGLFDGSPWGRYEALGYDHPHQGWHVPLYREREWEVVCQFLKDQIAISDIE